MTTFQDPNNIVGDDGEETVATSLRDARNTVVVHVGGELQVNDDLAVRLGYAYDPHILPENTVNPAPPDSDRHLVALGASYFLGDYGVHAHFSNAFFVRRETATNDLPGEWSGGWAGGTMAYIAGLTVSVKLWTAFGRTPLLAVKVSA